MRCCPRSAHSQITRTRQPAAKRSLTAFWSLASLSSSFWRQKSFRVSGSFESAHLWKCQKQPWMNAAVRYRGKTRSGRPGRFLSYSRYLSPLACSPHRISISGLVSRLRMRLMLSWRCLAVSTSAIHSSSTRQHPRLWILGSPSAHSGSCRVLT